MSPLGVTQHKPKSPPADSLGTSIDPPTNPPPVKQKPQVPKKPQMKRVSFTSEAQDMTNESNERNITHLSHDTSPMDTTNDACQGNSSLLIKHRPTKIVNETKSSIVRPEEFIIPPPPLFATKVSLSHLVHEAAPQLDAPLITVVPERVVLPEPIVAETTVQSSNSTNSPETEFPPPVNYNAHPILDSSLRLDRDPLAAPIFSEVPSPQVFRNKLPSSESSEYFEELSVSPVGEPEPPELLHAQYKTLPSVSHVPNSPCYLHPMRGQFDDSDANYYTLRDLRVKNISPNMVHSITYPPCNPYPSLTTVAGTFNPYTCTVPSRASSDESFSPSKPQLSPSLISSVGKDINANVTQLVTIKEEDAPKSVQLERRVRFGEVTTAPEINRFSMGSETAREGSTSPASTLKPSWSSKIKSFAIGEVIIIVRHYPQHSASYDCVRRQPVSIY